MTAIDRDQALAALERVSLNFDGDAITALYLGSQAVAALPAIPLDDEYLPEDLQRVYSLISETMWLHDEEASDESGPTFNGECMWCGVPAPCKTRSKMEQARAILDFESASVPVLETTDSPKCPLCDDTGWVNVGLGFDADPRDAVRCERGCPAEKRSPVPVLETKKEES